MGIPFFKVPLWQKILIVAGIVFILAVFAWSNRREAEAYRQAEEAIRVYEQSRRVPAPPPR